MTTLSTATRGLSPPTSELDQLLEDRARAVDLLTRAIDMIAEANFTHERRFMPAPATRSAA